MPCWVAIASLMDSTTAWRHTESTGRYPKTIRSPHRSITSAKGVKRSIVGPRARSRWQFPCVASGSEVGVLRYFPESNASSTSCEAKTYSTDPAPVVSRPFSALFSPEVLDEHQVSLHSHLSRIHN